MPDVIQYSPQLYGDSNESVDGISEGITHDNSDHSRSILKNNVDSNKSIRNKRRRTNYKGAHTLCYLQLVMLFIVSTNIV